MIAKTTSHSSTLNPSTAVAAFYQTKARTGASETEGKKDMLSHARWPESSDLCGQSDGLIMGDRKSDEPGLLY